MAQIITNTSGFKTGGEKRFSECLKDKCDPSAIGWYEAPVGNLGSFPDFVLLSPKDGLWIFEVKDWGGKTIASCSKQEFVLNTPRGTVLEKNPYDQVTGYAHQITRLLEQDKALLSAKGKLFLPWSVGIVLPNMTRKTFNDLELTQVIPPDLVICKDEMSASVSPAEFLARLRKNLRFKLKIEMTREEVDRIRAAIYPELKFLHHKDDLTLDLPESSMDIVRIMDLAQEQLARSLGNGHRVIHGVAGSGKTMILLFRAQYLSRIAGKPTLILCYNASLASYLKQLVQNKNLGANVIVKTFHGWCRDQIDRHGIKVPSSSEEDKHQVLVDCFLDAVEKRKIPFEQYNAILIDEGHDFKPEWLHSVVRMLDQKYDSLLLLYDDAQSIYDRSRKRNFSFRSAGIHAQGRTSVLKLNYRNSVQILNLAAEFAQDILTPEDAEDDGIPILKPEGIGRQGSVPDIVQKRTLEWQADYLADSFKAAHRTGLPWSDMAIVYRATPTDKIVLEAFEKKDIPCGKKNTFDLAENSVKFVTMHSCKGLEATLVGIPGLDQLPFKDGSIIEEGRLLYVAMTRAKTGLIMTYSKVSDFTDRLLAAKSKIGF